jgi:beta-galactosidase
MAALEKCGGIALLGPRTNSKTPELAIPSPLPPNLTGMDTTVSYVETFRADMPRPVEDGGHALHWVEHIEGTAPINAHLEDGTPLVVGDGSIRYLTAWLDEVALDALLRQLSDEQDLETTPLRGGLRIRRTQTHMFAFNYGREPVQFEGNTIAAAGVFWRAL